MVDRFILQQELYHKPIQSVGAKSGTTPYNTTEKERQDKNRMKAYRAIILHELSQTVYDPQFNL